MFQRCSPLAQKFVNLTCLVLRGIYMVLKEKTLKFKWMFVLLKIPHQTIRDQIKKKSTVPAKSSVYRSFLEYFDVIIAFATVPGRVTIIM